MDDEDLLTLKVGKEDVEVGVTMLDDNKTRLVVSLLWFESPAKFEAAAKEGLTTPKVGMADEGVDLPELLI